MILTCLMSLATLSTPPTGGTPSETRLEVRRFDAVPGVQLLMDGNAPASSPYEIWVSAGDPVPREITASRWQRRLAGGRPLARGTTSPGGELRVQLDASAFREGLLRFQLVVRDGGGLSLSDIVPLRVEPPSATPRPAPRDGGATAALGSVPVAVPGGASTPTGPRSGRGALPVPPPTGRVVAEQKISSTAGDFVGPLADEDFFGIRIAELGDLDGDGILDIAVGAPGDGGGGTDRGAIWILFLDTDGTVKAEQKIGDGQGGFGGTLENGDSFGVSVEAIGDLDGDGVVDLVAGASRDDDGGFNKGALWILYLNSDGTVKAEQKISQTEGGFGGTLGPGGDFGGSVSSLGDLDDDGVVDLAVGAAFDNTSGHQFGAVWILFLNANGTVKSEQLINDEEGGFTGYEPGFIFPAFGWDVAGIGDMDGDLVEDLVACMPNGGSPGQSGAVWILLLNTDGTVKEDHRILGTAPASEQAQFGSSVAALDDQDGNGVRDLAVGSLRSDDGGTDRGAIHIVLLNADGTRKSETEISDTEGGFEGVLDDGDFFGGAISAMGDLDGNGTLDLAVGATRDDDGGMDRGAVWILFL